MIARRPNLAQASAWLALTLSGCDDRQGIVDASLDASSDASVEAAGPCTAKRPQLDDGGALTLEAARHQLCTGADGGQPFGSVDEGTCGDGRTYLRTGTFVGLSYYFRDGGLVGAVYHADIIDPCNGLRFWPDEVRCDEPSAPRTVCGTP